MSPFRVILVAAGLAATGGTLLVGGGMLGDGADPAAALVATAEPSLSLPRAPAAATRSGGAAAEGLPAWRGFVHRTTDADAVSRPVAPRREVADPFARSAARDSLRAMDLELRGIVGHTALIGSRSVRVGAVLGRFTLRSIDDGAVTLEGPDGVEVRLELDGVAGR